MTSAWVLSYLIKALYSIALPHLICQSAFGWPVEITEQPQNTLLVAITKFYLRQDNSYNTTNEEISMSSSQPDLGWISSVSEDEAKFAKAEWEMLIQLLDKNSFLL